MPSISTITYTPEPVRPGHPCCIDITAHNVVAGPVTFTLELDPLLPYMFSIAGRTRTRITRRRNVPLDTGSYGTRMAFRIAGAVAGDALLMVTISGVNGTSPPYPLRLAVAADRHSR
jgi:hypothetical protein